MEFRQLKSLCLTVECRSLGDAEEHSFATASAICQQVKSLERDLGVKIFELKPAGSCSHRKAIG